MTNDCGQRSQILQLRSADTHLIFGDDGHRGQQQRGGRTRAAEADQLFSDGP